MSNVVVSQWVAGFPPASTAHIALHSGAMFRAEKPSGFRPHTAYYVGLDTLTPSSNGINIECVLAGNRDELQTILQSQAEV